MMLRLGWDETVPCVLLWVHWSGLTIMLMQLSCASWAHDVQAAELGVLLFSRL